MKIHGVTLVVSVSACLLLVGCGGVVGQDLGQQNDKKETTIKDKKGGLLYTRIANEQLEFLISGCKKYHDNTGQHVSKLADF